MSTFPWKTKNRGNLNQFKPEHITALEAKIFIKELGKASTPYVTCLVRGKPIRLTPEEAVRQLYLMVAWSGSGADAEFAAEKKTQQDWDEGSAAPGLG